MRENGVRRGRNYMKVVSLLYHDAVRDGDFGQSGIPGSGAAVYKLDIDDMQRHFAAIAASGAPRPSSIYHVLRETNHAGPGFLLTFDDGGVSASECIADFLEAHGWIGHFMITGRYIDRPGFVSERGIRELHERGHVIGSHSWSHPGRMSYCRPDELLDEWRRSVDFLSGIVGQPVDVASVPGGYFSAKVARAASACGIRGLFTSEPVKKTWRVDGCRVFGRYTILRGMRPEVSAALASETLSAQQARQYVYWNAKKSVKQVFGKAYLDIREHLLKKRNSTRNTSQSG